MLGAPTMVQACLGCSGRMYATRSSTTEQPIDSICASKRKRDDSRRLSCAIHGGAIATTSQQHAVLLQCLVLRAFPDLFSFDEGLQDDALVAERLATHHEEVGVFSSLQRADAIGDTHRLSRVNRHHLQRLIDR